MAIAAQGKYQVSIKYSCDNEEQVKNNDEFPWIRVNPNEIYGGGRGRTYQGCLMAEARERNLDQSGWCSSRRWSRGGAWRRWLGSSASQGRRQDEEAQVGGEWKRPQALFIRRMDKWQARESRSSKLDMWQGRRLDSREFIKNEDVYMYDYG